MGAWPDEAFQCMAYLGKAWWVGKLMVGSPEEVDTGKNSVVEWAAFDEAASDEAACDEAPLLVVEVVRC